MPSSRRAAARCSAKYRVGRAAGPSEAMTRSASARSVAPAPASCDERWPASPGPTAPERDACPRCLDDDRPTGGRPHDRLASQHERRSAHRNIATGLSSSSRSRRGTQPSSSGTSYSRPGAKRAQKCRRPGTITLHHGEPDVGARLVEDEHLQTLRLEHRMAPADVGGEVVAEGRVVVEAPGGTGRDEMRLVGAAWPCAASVRSSRSSSPNSPPAGSSPAGPRVATIWLSSVSAREHGDPRVEVGAEPEDDLLGPAVVAPRHADVRRDAEVVGDVEHGHVATEVGVRRPQVVDVRVGEAVEVDAGAGDPVVPPHGDGVALHELERALQDGLGQRGAGGAAVGVGAAGRRVLLAGDAVVAEAGGEVPHGVGGQRPHRGPVDGRRLVEAGRHLVEGRRVERSPLGGVVVLGVAPAHARVGVDGVVAELAEGRPPPRLGRRRSTRSTARGIRTGALVRACSRIGPCRRCGCAGRPAAGRSCRRAWPGWSRRGRRAGDR